jgi:hypothetical protein
MKFLGWSWHLEIGSGLLVDEYSFLTKPLNTLPLVAGHSQARAVYGGVNAHSQLRRPISNFRVNKKINFEKNQQDKLLQYAL